MKTMRRFRKAAVIAMAIMMALMACVPAMAEQAVDPSKQGDHYVENGQILGEEGWNWRDDNNDGVAECYYLEHGNKVTSTVTPDGYTVDDQGRWVVDGVVQEKVLWTAEELNSRPEWTPIGADSSQTKREDVVAILSMLQANGGGWNMEAYKNQPSEAVSKTNGIKSYKTEFAPEGSVLEGLVVGRSDGDGIVQYDPNYAEIIETESGYDVHRVPGGMNFYAAGQNRSIRLNYEPVPVSELKPNWLYSPEIVKTNSPWKAPAVLAISKAAAGESFDGKYYASLSHDEYGIEAANIYHQKHTIIDWAIDTSGSWVQDTTKAPTGSNKYDGTTGTLTNWRYRFIDGTYAANGEYRIYRSSSLNDLMDGAYYLFNEDGYLLTNVMGYGYYYDEFGRVTDYTFGTDFCDWRTFPNDLGYWREAQFE